MSKKVLNKDALIRVIEAISNTDFKKENEPMNLNTITNEIKQWAIDRGLDQADPSKQMLKVMEEVGEIAEALAKGDEKALQDGIGDGYVTLVILALILNYDIEGCILTAYNEIKDRKGKMVNGVFVKESDLK